MAGNMVFAEKNDYVTLSDSEGLQDSHRDSPRHRPMICYELPRIAKQFEFKNQAVSLRSE
jgi:hypothetical protein